MNPTGDDPNLLQTSRELLELHWRDEGFTMPNAGTYPWQWLWDSCFHALVWAELGDERAITEIRSLFAFQTERGFVPHMNYFPDPAAAIEPWGREGASTITQPPMYGHAIAHLEGAGMSVGEETTIAAERGLRFLLNDRRRTAEGLVELCHPWESGCDDSARWDAALPEPWTRERWREHKWKLVGTVTTDDQGGAIANDEFRIGSIGFNALVAWNCIELARVTGSDDLQKSADELAEIISSRWDDDLRSWVDAGDLAESSGRVRTLDAHFALLVDPDPNHRRIGFGDLVDERAFGARFGPAGIHRDEPTLDHDTYWRGPSWPQMSYLLWAAAATWGEATIHRLLGESLIRGATESGWAEFWNPDTGAGLGAIPQSWATVAALVV
ncbi:MAG: hypothetical protein AAF567_21060 [Actinomycetota bacterium]